MRRGRVVVWVVLLAVQCWILYTPDVGDGPGFLAPLWDVTRPWPGPTAPDEVGFDRLVHFSSFGLVTAVGLWAGLPGWVAVGLPLVHAPLSELIQWAWFPGRSGDPRDAAADVAGILVAWAVIVLWQRHAEGGHDGLDEDGAGPGKHQAGTVPQAGGPG